MNVCGIVVAGGSGVRYGRRKQLDLLQGRRVLDWSVDCLRSTCRSIVVVVPPDLVDSVDLGTSVLVVAGGETRSDSVRAGLEAVAPDTTHVLVHDAARPLASHTLVRRVVDALEEGAVGVVPVVPVTDSLRTVYGRPIDRSELVAVQTPQGFGVDALRRAHASVAIATDDASLLADLGLDVIHVDGEPSNIKITAPQDLAIATALVGADTPDG